MPLLSFYLSMSLLGTLQFNLYFVCFCFIFYSFPESNQLPFHFFLLFYIFLFFAFVFLIKVQVWTVFENGALVTIAIVNCTLTELATGHIELST